MKRFLIMFFSLIMATIFAFPNLAFFGMFFFAYYGKYVSAVFCLIFAYNSAKFVQYMYERSLSKERKESDTSRGKDDNGGEFHYEIVDEEIHFTFIVKDHDGRQLDRLKFMRKQFFKDK